MVDLTKSSSINDSSSCSFNISSNENKQSPKPTKKSKKLKVLEWVNFKNTISLFFCYKKNKKQNNNLNEVVPAVVEKQPSQKRTIKNNDKLVANGSTKEIIQENKKKNSETFDLTEEPFTLSYIGNCHHLVTLSLYIYIYLFFLPVA